jgi:hypothetical protein
MARGEDLNGLRAAAQQRVEQPRVQALLEKDLCGDSGLHHFIG